MNSKSQRLLFLTLFLLVSLSANLSIARRPGNGMPYSSETSPIFEGNITATTHYQSSYRFLTHAGNYHSGEAGYVSMDAENQCAKKCFEKYGTREDYLGYETIFVAKTGQSDSLAQSSSSEDNFSALWRCYCTLKVKATTAPTTPTPAPGPKSSCSESYSVSNLDLVEKALENYLAKNENPKLQAEVDKLKTLATFDSDDEATKVIKNKSRLDLLVGIFSIDTRGDLKDNIANFIGTREGDLKAYTRALVDKFGINESEAKMLILDVQEKLKYSLLQK